MATSDPRVFFAGERTLLAWVRTGLTIMGFGFVVARFGLFLRLMAFQQSAASRAAPALFSTAVGVALVLLGAFILFFAARQHHVFVRGLSPGDVPPSYRTAIPGTVAVLLGALGLALALYLVI